MLFAHARWLPYIEQIQYTEPNSQYRHINLSGYFIFIFFLFQIKLLKFLYFSIIIIIYESL